MSKSEVVMMFIVPIVLVILIFSLVEISLSREIHVEGTIIDKVDEFRLVIRTDDNITFVIKVDLDAYYECEIGDHFEGEIESQYVRGPDRS